MKLEIKWKLENIIFLLFLKIIKSVSFIANLKTSTKFTQRAKTCKMFKTLQLTEEERLFWSLQDSIFYNRKLEIKNQFVDLYARGDFVPKCFSSISLQSFVEFANLLLVVSRYYNRKKNTNLLKNSLCKAVTCNTSDAKTSRITFLQFY